MEHSIRMDLLFGCTTNCDLIHQLLMYDWWCDILVTRIHLSHSRLLTSMVLIKEIICGLQTHVHDDPGSAMGMSVVAPCSSTVSTATQSTRASRHSCHA